MSGRAGYHELHNITLDCQHTITITAPPPNVGAEQYCRKCGTWRTVVKAPPMYFVRCETGACPLNTNTGDSRELAMIKARNHIGKRPKHKVAVFDGRVRIAEITNTEEAMFQTQAELRAVARANARDLRRLFGVAVSRNVCEDGSRQDERRNGNGGTRTGHSTGGGRSGNVAA